MILLRQKKNSVHKRRLQLILYEKSYFEIKRNIILTIVVDIL